MPPVVAFVAAAIVSLGVGAVTAGIIASVVVGVALSLAVSLVTQALTGKPKSLTNDRGQTLTFRAAAPAAPIIYGETRVGGPIVFMTTTGSAPQSMDDNKRLWMVIAVAGHEVEAISDVYFADEIVSFDAENVAYQGIWGSAIGAQASDPAGGLRGLAYLIKRLGTYNQSVNPNMLLLSGINGIITASDTFKGIAHLSVLLVHDANKYPSGPPNISAKVKGRKVYDPRNGAHSLTNPATWTWSNNAALCVADYLRGCPMESAAGVVIRPYGVQASDASIDWASVTTAANICDESVSVLGGGNEARYTCNGSIDSDVSPKNALQSLISSMAGHVAWSGGQWKIFAGAYRTPTVTFTDDDQCGPAKTQAKRARRDLFNGIKGKFLGPRTFYQTTDFPNVTSATFVAQDNGEEIWQNIELPFTDSPSACQRISRIDLLRNRQQITTERRFKLSALGTQVGDTIMLTDSRKGWVAKPFEIARWSLTSEPDETGVPYLAIDMTLIETASSVYAWTLADEWAFDDAPDSNLPRPWDVLVPGGPGIVEELYQTREGSGVKTRVTLSWASSLEGYLLDYISEFKLSSASTWTVLPSVTGTTIIINDIAAGIYDFRVKTRNVLGVSSAYSTSMGLTVYGLGAAPAALANLGIQPLGNQAMLAWTQSTDLDVREGGRIEFRHSSALSGVTWANSTSIREAVSGQQSYATVPMKLGTYVVRPVDSSGIAGPETTVSSKQASINGFSSLGGSPVTEETAFAGVHTNTVPSPPVLKLANVGMWDDIADLDLLTQNIDDFGGLQSTGSYAFAGSYDFGAVTRVRLTSKLAATVTSTLNNIDDIAANIDDWDSFDGSLGGGQADAWVEFRQTDDNPAGSPTWTSWMRLDAAEAECRGVQARAQLRSLDASYNIEISTLQVAAEQRT